MFLKKLITLSLSLVMCSSIFVGCITGGGEPPVPPAPPPTESYIPTVTSVPYGERIPTPDKDVMEDFEFGVGGFSESSFYINENKWGYNNNGVKGKNVGYTEDGVAVLKAYGDYAQDELLKRSGSCLLSRDYLTPGLIEVSMKIMPRLGGCTAIWPFYAGTEVNTDNYLYQEIDIEYPAGNETINGVFHPATYENVMNTNYADNWSESNSGPYLSTKTETLTPANDGAWHKYSILWETSPEPRIRYYVDGVLTSDTNDDPKKKNTVSFASAPLQIGVWFPNGWAGDRDFDEAAALVDWVSYKAIPKQPYKEAKAPEIITGLPHASLYPRNPIKLESHNYISNGNFENATMLDQEKKPLMPWGGDYSSSMLVKNGDNGSALSLAAGKRVSQIITAVYGKSRNADKNFGDISYFYEYELQGSFIASGEVAGTVKVEFLDANGRVIDSGTKLVTLAKTGDFMLIAKSVNGSKKMRVTLSSDKGNAVFDNLNMTLVRTSK